MRILLENEKGPRSYKDSKTVNETEYETFEESARKRNLLIDDREWNITWNEAISTQTSDQIRKLFAYICLFNNPNNPIKLFTDYLQYMYDDIYGENIETKQEKVLEKKTKYFILMVEIMDHLDCQM